MVERGLQVVWFSEGGLVRSIARQQQSVSPSSCEAELYALYSSFSQWLSQTWLAFMDERQYGNYHEIAA